MPKDFHRGKDGLEKDIDFHNQRLWKRKKYRSQREKDVKKKTFRDFKKVAESESKAALVNVDEKQRKFYENLFTPSDTPKGPQEETKSEGATPAKKTGAKFGKKAKQGFKVKIKTL